jgi:hypothetical protein
VQAYTGQLDPVRPTAEKLIATKPTPQQPSAEPVRTRGELPVIWVAAAAILIAVVSVMTATTYLPHEWAVAFDQHAGVYADFRVVI